MLGGVMFAIVAHPLAGGQDSRVSFDRTAPREYAARMNEASSFARRRAAFFDAMASASPSAVAVVPAAPVFVRNNDVEHEYRQDSDFFYLTGLDEPESVAIFDAKARTMTLFVRPRDPDREIWDGPRTGVDGARSVYGANEAFVVSELDEKLSAALQNHRRVYYRLGKNRPFDDRVLAVIDRLRTRQRSGAAAPSEIVDTGDILHEMRLRKSPGEVETMRAAAAITREAHELAMAKARPGMFEYEVEALLLDTFRRHGSERPAYGSIVGSGPNACVLHYRKNDRRIDEGDLLLIDAGCEYGYYASDVTRTFPVGRDFSRAQQAIYELVLEAQLEGIAATRAGVTLDDVHKLTVDVVTRGLVRLGLLSGEPEKLVESGAYKRFFMHRTSHWLGMDVHDVGAYFADGSPRPLDPGMVLTIEPGIYISPADDQVGPEWRGIGVRIEDDVLVGEGGPVVLTAGIPKTVEELRAARTGS
jgi:Xaa-Pro aminopeptidase